jgi:hypothetical protein
MYLGAARSRGAGPTEAILRIRLRYGCRLKRMQQQSVVQISRVRPSGAAIAASVCVWNTASAAMELISRGQLQNTGIVPHTPVIVDGSCCRCMLLLLNT